MLYPKQYYIPEGRTPLQNALIELWEKLSAGAQEVINHIERPMAYSQGYYDGMRAAFCFVALLIFIIKTNNIIRWFWGVKR